MDVSNIANRHIAILADPTQYSTRFDYHYFFLWYQETTDDYIQQFSCK